MIKNTFLKNFLINTVFKAISAVNAATPEIDRQILFYSDMGFRDNIKYLFDYAIKTRLNERYRLVCAVSDYREWEERNPGWKNVVFVSPVRGVLEYLRSGHIYYCFGRLPIIPSGHQTACQMWHGTSFKAFAKDQVQSVSLKNQFYTHVFASSEYFRPIVEKKFQCLPDRVVINGHPRTDVFYLDEKLYDVGKCRRFILWLPTFRKSSSVAMTEGEDELVPVFHREDLKDLDQKLREMDVKVLIKLHPVQDTEGLDVSAFSHLILMTNREFIRRGYDLYRLLRQADALITDYSSVFYDYLLLDRPIGFTEDDMESYRDSRGFAVDPEKFRPGERIRNREDFYRFVGDVADGRDSWRARRHEIDMLSNQYHDGRNSERAFQMCGISVSRPAGRTKTVS